MYVTLSEGMEKLCPFKFAGKSSGAYGNKEKWGPYKSLACETDNCMGFEPVRYDPKRGEFIYRCKAVEQGLTKMNITVPDTDIPGGAEP